MILAVVMVLAMSVVAFADETYTITISNSAEGYTYTAYQIFTGDLSEDGVTLSNVTWGNGIDSTSEALQSALNEAYGTTDASEIAELITTSDEAAAFAEIVASYLTDTYCSSGYDENYTINVTGAGYYLIKNTEVPDGNYAYSDYIMKVVEDTTATPKSDVPSSDKTVADINDSTETEATVSTSGSADYDIGDDVPFTLTATLPSSYYDTYTTYKLVFHDDLSNGLSFNNDVTVTVTTNNTTTTVASGYTVVTTDLTDGCDFEVQITDTNKLYDSYGEEIDVAAGSVITVKYTAKLSGENVVIGEPGNPNTMYITYSNNPNDDSKIGKTEESTVVVYTYELIVNKVDEDGNALDGAAFTLYKYDADTETYTEGEAVEATVTYEAVEINEFASGITYYTESNGAYIEVTDTSGEPDSGTSYYVKKNQFIFKGLDDGIYKLSETRTPDGYNTMVDIVFTVSATHDETEIQSLSITENGDTSTDITVENASTGIITTTITNNAGSTLPSTGGIGTTIFYIIGGVLVAGAAVLLVTKKRLGKME